MLLTKGSLLGAVLCLAVLGQPYGYALRPRAKDQEKQLTAKIERENNPGKKARLQIRLARVKLLDAIQAYDANNFDEGWALLKEYREQINLSWKTLEGSERGVAKHIEAYKKLEINLRENARLIEDLRRRVPYPENESIETVVKENTRVHNQVMGVLFPAGSPPEKSKKPRRQGALAAGISWAMA